MKNLPAFLSRRSRRVGLEIVDDASKPYRPLLASWLIEISLLMGWTKPRRRFGQHKFIFSDEDFAELAGFDIQLSEDGEDYCVDLKGEKITLTLAVSVRMLKARLRELQSESIDDDLWLFANIDMLGKLLGLSDAGKAVLLYAAVVEVFPVFKRVLSGRSTNIKIQRLAQVISCLTGYPETSINAEFGKDSVLVASGILSINDESCGMEDLVSMLDGFGSLLCRKHESDRTLVQSLLKKAGEGGLGLDDYPHLRADIETVIPYLENVMKGSVQGANILIYGAPGTGKTEFVKAISSEIGTDLYEIAYSDEDGNPRKGSSRLRVYSFCQRVLAARKNVILMFDEIEDVFPGHWNMCALGGKDDERGTTSKAWINRTLEGNMIPTFWVTNDQNIDPAFLRRFDYSIRFSVPPKHVRMGIARRHLGQFSPTDQWLSGIASSEQVTPSQYERAAKVGKIASGGNDERARRLVEQALDRSALLLGQKRIAGRATRQTGYDPKYVNTSMDLCSMLSGLRSKRRGTFCFYGPAGTGKSEFAKYIADEIGMPLIIRRASDILSMWVGESEKNIAQMFADAREQESVLVLDEADSFLADRRDVVRNWEVTQVNELLTQMEAFDGIFICTTNLMDRLDQASLRRFSFKVKFDYLRPDQSWAMFQQELESMEGNRDSARQWEKKVKSLGNLTPGDFAVAARQFDLFGREGSAEWLYGKLIEECRMKGMPSSGIGFLRKE